MATFGLDQAISPQRVQDTSGDPAFAAELLQEGAAGLGLRCMEPAGAATSSAAECCCWKGQGHLASGHTLQEPPRALWRCSTQGWLELPQAPSQGVPRRRAGWPAAGHAVADHAARARGALRVGALDRRPAAELHHTALLPGR